MEGIEHSTQAGATLDCDTPLLIRAVRVLQMKQRAEEEIEIVKEDMKRSADFHTAEHSLLCSHLNEMRSKTPTSYHKGCINLLCHRLLQCEITLNLYSKTFYTHISYEYPTNVLMLETQNSADSNSENFEDLPLSSSEDTSESDSSSESEAED